MNQTIHNAALSNFTADRGSDGVFFYSMAKYWTADHDHPVEPWAADENQEFFLEVRSYIGPAPCRREERKYSLTPSQYSLLLFELGNHGPAAAHLYIEGQRSTWLAADIT